MVCGSNKHKVKDCLRARSFTAPHTGGIASIVQEGSKDNKSVASPSAPRQATQTMGRQDARAPTRAYAMKAVEDKDAPYVIVGYFNIFDTIVHALIDPRSTHSYVCTSIPSLGSLPRSETKHDILVTNPIRHSVVVNGIYNEFKELRNKRIPLVKVLWKNHKMEEATWKSEETMHQQYPQMFNEGNLEDEIF